jgi:hypothetical protein
LKVPNSEDRVKPFAEKLLPQWLGFTDNPAVVLQKILDKRRTPLARARGCVRAAIWAQPIGSVVGRRAQGAQRKSPSQSQ